MYTLKFTLIIVYIFVNDNTRNKLTEEEVLAIGMNIHGKYIIVRDFSSHIGNTGKQKINNNSMRVFNISEHLNLNILNCDIDSEGERTWQRDD